MYVFIILKGIITKSTGSWYQVLESETGRFYEARIRGKFKLIKTRLTNPLAVGDEVVFELEHDDIAWIVPHQANLRIIDATAKRLGVDMEKVMINIQKYGNTTAASIPIALTEAHEMGLFKAGDLVCLTAFGSGFTWGAVLMRWMD